MPSSKTNWTLVVLFITAGVIAACQIGKVAIAVPLLRRDLGMSIVAASWMLGAYGMLGAIGGLAAGVAASRFGLRQTLVTGMALIAAGNILGFVAHDTPLLLASRIIEGCGFLTSVIAASTLLANVTAPQDRDFVFGFWGAYIPVGTAIMLLGGPLLAAHGWQTLWLVNAIAASIFTVVLWFAVPAGIAPPRERGLAALKNAGRVLRDPGPLLLAAAFGLYAFQYYAITNFLPVLLVERMGLPIGLAGTLSALAVIANAAGNIAAGGIMRRGVPIWAIAATAFVTVAIASFGVFTEGLPVAAVAGFASLSLFVTGVLPASILAAAPRLAPGAAVLALIMGMIQQTANLGQLFGSTITGAWVEHLGWSRAPFLFAVIGTAGFALALGIRRVMAKAKTAR